MLVITGITVYGYETYYVFSGKVKLYNYNKNKWVSYDTRTQMEVLDDLINFGIKAFPNATPGPRLTDNGIIFNLGGISNITTILTNESGYYPIIKTDEHGFNNPSGLYNENAVDIVLTGDSFVEGFSVNQNESISAVLREAGYRAISLGRSNNGPLTEFAALKEYAEPLKPKIVLWVYFYKNLGDLIRELKLPVLRKYLDKDGFSQNLISRQEEIDSVLINDVPIPKIERVKDMKNKIVHTMKLSNIRRWIHLLPKPRPIPRIPSAPITIFKDILQQSKQMVSEWGGEMYFVYLPSVHSQIPPVDWNHFFFTEARNREIVMQTLTELDIPIIDIQNEVFKIHPDPLSLFPFIVKAHYNAEGYRLVAEAIIKQLDADHYITIN